MPGELRVGDAFAPGLPRLPEGCWYAWDGRHAPAAHHRLLVVAEAPAAAELRAFQRGGQVDLALLVDGPAVVLLWRATGWPWSDAPYAWHLQRAAKAPGELGVPSTAPLPEGAGVPLDLVLVDGATGRIAALRQVAMPGRFASALHEAIATQAAAPWDARAYDAHLARLTTESALELAVRAEVRCTLGIGGGAGAVRDARRRRD